MTENNELDPFECTQPVLDDLNLGNVVSNSIFKTYDENIWGVLRSFASPETDILLCHRIKDGEKDCYSIGRKVSNDIVIQDKRVSSNHCIVYCDYQNHKIKIYIEDLSANGVFINHDLRKVGKGSRMELKTGDEIYLLNPKHKDETVKEAAFTFINLRERMVDSRQVISGRLNTDIKSRHIEDDYILGDQLGAGMSGQVFFCVNRATRMEYAVKFIDTRKFSLSPGLSLDDLKFEAEMMAQLDHPGIIKIVDTYQSDFALYIVMELVRGGDLFDRIVERRRYTEEKARLVMRNVLSAVSYLHANNIIHRDLKPENILLVDRNNDTEVKITDFGLAKKTNQEGLKTFCGTPQYFAPEVLKRKNSVFGLGRYHAAVDMWSLGVVLFILLSGTFPFDEEQLFTQIQKGSYSMLSAEWSDISPSAKHLIRSMMNLKPEARINVDDALKHPWILGQDTVDGGYLTRHRLKEQSTEISLVQKENSRNITESSTATSSSAMILSTTNSATKRKFTEDPMITSIVLPVSSKKSNRKDSVARVQSQSTHRSTGTSRPHIGTVPLFITQKKSTFSQPMDISQSSYASQLLPFGMNALFFEGIGCNASHSNALNLSDNRAHAMDDTTGRCTMPPPSAKEMTAVTDFRNALPMSNGLEYLLKSGEFHDSDAQLTGAVADDIDEYSSSGDDAEVVKKSATSVKRNTAGNRRSKQKETRSKSAQKAKKKGIHDDTSTKQQTLSDIWGSSTGQRQGSFFDGSSTAMEIS